MAQMADDILNHDHRTIRNHSEVQGAERKGVCGNASEIEAGGGKQ